MPSFVFSHVLNIYQNDGSTVHAKQWFLCTITCFCRYLYSPYIAPGGQSKTPFFLLFIRACCQFFLLHRPAGFSRLLLLLLLPPLPVPPLSTAVQVQRCRWCQESRRHTHTQAVLGNSLRIHFDTAGFEAQRKHTHTHTPLHTHKHIHKHSWAHPQSLHTPCAASHKHTAGLFAAGWRLWHCVAVFWCFEESEIQVGEMAVTECLEIKRQWDFIQSKNFLAYFLKQSSIGQILKSNPCRKHTRKSFMLQQCWLNSSGRTGAVEAGEAFQSKM